VAKEDQNVCAFLSFRSLRRQIQVLKLHLLAIRAIQRTGAHFVDQSGARDGLDRRLKADAAARLEVRGEGGGGGDQQGKGETEDKEKGNTGKRRGMRRGKERGKAKKDQALTAAGPKGLTKAAWTWSSPSKRPTTTARTSATTLPGRPGIGERGRTMLCCALVVVVDAV